MPAIDFASTNLAPLASKHPEFITDLNHAMAILVYERDRLPDRVACLLQYEHRRDVAEDVNKVVRRAQGLPENDKMHLLLRLRAWAEQKGREHGRDLPATLDIGLDPLMSEADHGRSSNGHARQENGRRAATVRNGDSMDQ